MAIPAFLSIIAAFLALAGSPDSLAQPESAIVLPRFSNILKVEKSTPAPSSSLTIEVFDRFNNCPACDSFALHVLPRLQERYKEDQKIKVKLYLIPDLNDPEETEKVIAAHCADDQGKFFEAHQKFHAHDIIGKDMNDFYKRFAKAVGLDPTLWMDCIKTAQYQSLVETEVTYRQSKSPGLPLPLITIDPYHLTGAQPIENIEWIIRRLTSL